MGKLLPHHGASALTPLLIEGQARAYYYGPSDAHRISHEIQSDSLVLQPLEMDWTFYCNKCESMASMKMCPHSKEDRLLLSGAMLRKTLSEGGEIPKEFSKPEVLDILRDHYSNLHENVEIKSHRAAMGEESSQWSPSAMAYRQGMEDMGSGAPPECAKGAV